MGWWQEPMCKACGNRVSRCGCAADQLVENPKQKGVKENLQFKHKSVPKFKITANKRSFSKGLRR
jgi:hypothetical protein